MKVPPGAEAVEGYLPLPSCGSARGLPGERQGLFRLECKGETSQLHHRGPECNRERNRQAVPGPANATVKLLAAGCNR